MKARRETRDTCLRSEEVNSRQRQKRTANYNAAACINRDAPAVIIPLVFINVIMLMNYLDSEEKLGTWWYPWVVYAPVFAIEIVILAMAGSSLHLFLRRYDGSTGTCHDLWRRSSQWPASTIIRKVCGSNTGAMTHGCAVLSLLFSIPFLICLKLMTIIPYWTVVCAPFWAALLLVAFSPCAKYTIELKSPLFCCLVFGELVVFIMSVVCAIKADFATTIPLALALIPLWFIVFSFLTFISVWACCRICKVNTNRPNGSNREVIVEVIIIYITLLPPTIWLVLLCLKDSGVITTSHQIIAVPLFIWLALFAIMWLLTFAVFSARERRQQRNQGAIEPSPIVPKVIVVAV